jgi:hypothetical protein
MERLAKRLDVLLDLRSAGHESPTLDFLVIHQVRQVLGILDFRDGSVNASPYDTGEHAEAASIEVRSRAPDFVILPNPEYIGVHFPRHPFPNCFEPTADQSDSRGAALASGCRRRSGKFAAHRVSKGPSPGSSTGRYRTRVSSDRLFGYDRRPSTKVSRVAGGVSIHE